VNRTYGNGGELLYQALLRASRVAEANELAGTMSHAARAGMLAASAPAVAAAHLDAAIAEYPKERLEEEYREGLRTEAEVLSFPLPLALIALRLGREREARETLAAVDRDIRARVRSVRPEPLEAHPAPPPRDPWERAKIRREDLGGIRATVVRERLRNYRDRRKILSSLLRLAIGLAPTNEADLGRALLHEVSTALEPCWEEGADVWLFDSEQRQLADALLAYREVSPIGPLLDRNRKARWYASRSASFAGLLREVGHKDGAARVLRSAIDSILERAAGAGRPYETPLLRWPLRDEVVLIAVEVGALLGPSASRRIDEAFERADQDLWPIEWLEAELKGR
jgi:hypothetical protein